MIPLMLAGSVFVSVSPVSVGFETVCSMPFTVIPLIAMFLVINPNVSIISVNRRISPIRYMLLISANLMLSVFF
ncbi:hypothetical protein SUGI_0253870 [Cryptomeria japonica]|nr:hypothetical protein SUGI_0253870 [Cryptomeria japonica]